MADLNSAAQAVLIAEAKSRCLREERGCHPDDPDWNGCYICVHRRGLAAALRAVADQVVPWQPEPTEDSVGPTIDYGYAWALFCKANDVRQELIAIADELELS